ncbi:TY-Chap domain-containing protein [Spongisporangium articulatum]|uniref:TY-Chap domain-containing protein n=1 Tax=Spongisporangium articulatum TaxID=3362603 RepID=A0ABW8AL77_9ACTN
MDERWEAVRDRIRSELETLGLPEALVISEPPAYGPVPRTVWWQFWRSSKPEQLPGVFVQFGQFWAEDLMCEFVGSTVIGGSYPMSAQQHEQLRQLGWLTPEDPQYREAIGKGVPNYAMRPHPVEVERVSAIAAESLSLFVADPTVLAYERVS